MTSAPPIEDFDLLAGHDLGDTGQFLKNDDDGGEDTLLVWQKLETPGFHPAAREGHSAFSCGSKVFIFGGFEAGRRMNNTIVLDVQQRHWSTPNMKGTLPAARSYHASSGLDHLMIVHGGEAVVYTDEHGIHHPIDMGMSQESSHADGTTAANTMTMSSSMMNVPSYEKTIGASKGVCPGDNLQCMKLGPAVRLSSVNSTNDLQAVRNLNNMNSASIISCLDDMYALDTKEMMWFSIKCALAPLPRKGHTLNLVMLNNRRHFMLFGGYSSENITLSNTLLVCDAEKVKEYCEISKKLYYKQIEDEKEKERQKELFGGITVGGTGVAVAPATTATTTAPITSSTKHHHNRNQMKPINKDYDLQSIVWRTVQCKGNAPSPRYRHTATVVPGTVGESLLVIVGGIGKESQTALHDVYILDIDNLCWNTLKNGNDALIRGLGGDGPIGGIFGHTAFPIIKKPPLTGNTSNDNNKGKKPNRVVVGTNGQVKNSLEDDIMNNNPFNNDNIQQYELLVFGGSSNPTAMKSHCYSCLFAFDITNHDWRRVTTGHAFPNSRSNHSVTMMHGWAPFHEMPYKSHNVSKHNRQIVMNKTNNSMNGGTIDTTTNTTTNTNSCAVIFGGVGALMASDTWALDLQWRPAGVGQYDQNTNQMVQYKMNMYHQQDTDNIVDDTMPVDVIDNPDQLNMTMNNGTPPSNNNTTTSHKIHNVNNEKYIGALMNSLPNAGGGTNGHNKKGQPSPPPPVTMDGLLTKQVSSDTILISGGSSKPPTPSHRDTSNSNNNTNNVPLLRQSSSQHFSTSGMNKLKVLKHFSASNRSGLMMDDTLKRSKSNLTGLDPYSNNYYDDRDDNEEDVMTPEVVGEAVLMLRKERAQTDIQLQEERDKNVVLGETIESLNASIAELKQEIVTINEQHANEVQTLKKLLNESMRREGRLRELNQEAYTLLTLYGIQSIPMASPRSDSGKAENS